jgi:hypothetical protein
MLKIPSTLRDNLEEKLILTKPTINEGNYREQSHKLEATEEISTETHLLNSLYDLDFLQIKISPKPKIILVKPAAKSVPTASELPKGNTMDVTANENTSQTEISRIKVMKLLGADPKRSELSITINEPSTDRLKSEQPRISGSKLLNDILNLFERPKKASKSNYRQGERRNAVCEEIEKSTILRSSSSSITLYALRTEFLEEMMSIRYSLF